ncbi:MAG TPA: hypothetical protein VGD56_13490 [Gemmatirosa sp.]
MGTSVVDHVLSVEEVRKRFKDVNKAAMHQHAVIHYGERGADQLVIMSRELCDALFADRARSAAVQPGPYAAFNRALADGRLGGLVSAGATPEDRPARRRMPDTSDVSALSLAQMVAAGDDDRAPQRRRRAAGA